MKLVLLLLAISIICGARDIIFDSFDYNPKGSNDLIDFGTLKLRKSKAKNTYNLRGNFTVKRPLGNEEIVIFEVYKREGRMLVTTRYPFCEFTRIDKSFWPDLLKVSNMSEECPLEEDNYEIKRFVMNESRVPPGIPNGKYTFKIQVMEIGKIILEFELKITFK